MVQTHALLHMHSSKHATRMFVGAVLVRQKAITLKLARVGGQGEDSALLVHLRDVREGSPHVETI